MISDSRVIRGYVKKQYNASSVYIPYGGNHIDLNTSDCIEGVSRACTTSRKFALSICRIEPENNIEMILKAMKSALDYDLVVIGNWQDSSFSRALRAEFSNYDNVFLLDPIYDQRLLNQYRSGSSFYLHGHSAGGTNPSLVEAMYAGLPILAYAVDYNISTTHNQAVYFSNFSELIGLVDSLSDDELSTIGSRMKSIAEREYVWAKISAMYESVF